MKKKSFKAHVVRWYFDQNSQSCKRFSYGSCQGNGNRFLDLQECQATYGAREKEDPTPTSPASIATMLIDNGAGASSFDQAWNQVICQVCGPSRIVILRFFFTWPLNVVEPFSKAVVKATETTLNPWKSVKLLVIPTKRRSNCANCVKRC